ncbi:MAG: ABC transporter ATP-binding protein [Elusimicrobiota bacterium]
MIFLETTRLSYSYPDATPALKELNLSISANEKIGIIGHNGAGKTTLLLLLCGLIQGSGKVKIMGEELNNGNINRLRRNIGIVFQNPDDQLFMPSVEEDISFGLKNIGVAQDKIPDKIKEALQTVDLPGFEKKMSHHLSSGEKKRVALATVLAMEPKILILDEPAANLDPHARRYLINKLNSLDITTIIAGHDLEMILQTCRRVVLLKHGEKIADGPARQILSDKVLMESNLLEVPLSLRGEF